MIRGDVVFKNSVPRHEGDTAPEQRSEVQTRHAGVPMTPAGFRQRDAEEIVGSTTQVQQWWLQQVKK